MCSCARASLDWFHQLAKVFAFGLNLKSLADLVVVHKPANRPKSCSAKLATFNCNAIMAMEAPTTYTSFRTMAYELSCSNNTFLCKSQTSCLLILFPLLVIDEQAAKRKKPIKKTKDNQKKTKQYTFCHFLHFFAGRL